MCAAELKNKIKTTKKLISLVNDMQKPANFTYVDVVELTRALTDYLDKLKQSLEQVD